MCKGETDRSQECIRQSEHKSDTAPFSSSVLHSALWFAPSMLAASSATDAAACKLLKTRSILRVCECEPRTHMEHLIKMCSACLHLFVYVSQSRQIHYHSRVEDTTHDKPYIPYTYTFTLRRSCNLTRRLSKPYIWQCEWCETIRRNTARKRRSNILGKAMS